jgi:hypothetical protein
MPVRKPRAGFPPGILQTDGLNGRSAAGPEDASAVIAIRLKK